MRTLVRTVLAAATFVAVSVAATAGPAQAVFSGKNGLLVYQAQVGRHVQLFTVRPDGTGTRQITRFTDSDATNAIWSPDGTTIGFARQRKTKAELYTMNADGTALRPFDPSLRGLTAWFPDGRHMLVTRYLRWTIVTARGTQPQLADVPGSGGGTCILPDGKRAAFIASLGRTDGKAAVFVAEIHRGAGSLHRLTPWQKLGDKIDCSPDGTHIAFSTDFGPKSGNVFTVGVDGTGLKQLTHASGGKLNAGLDSWSPDGKEIAFASNRTGTYEIYSMNADGTGVRQITHGPEAHLASWGVHP